MTPDGTDPQARSRILALTKSVYFNRSGVLLLAATLLAGAVTVVAISSDEAQRQVLLAVATGLFSSTLYAFLETSLTAARYEALVSESVTSAVDTALDRVLEVTTTQHQEFLPSAVYSASAVPDKAFNRDLDEDLRRSNRYVFRGVTGKYAVARLCLQNSVVASADILVANPLARHGMAPRVTHIVSYAEPSATYAEVEQRLVDEIFEAVVGARSAAAKCHRLTFSFIDDPQIDRVELFDAALYLTLYSDTVGVGARFPKTLRFEPHTSLYKIYSAQLGRSADTAASSARISPSTTDAELVEVLRSLGCEGADETTVARYEEEFRAFVARFGDDIT